MLKIFNFNFNYFSISVYFFIVIENNVVQSLRLGFRLGLGLWTIEAIYIYKIAQSVFVCYLSPPKRLDLQRPKLACRRVPRLSYTWAGSFVDRGHHWEEN